ncbi:hypothetical protein JW859_08425 [bacterium]|nr:hypothetical protein [bacterium]
MSDRSNLEDTNHTPLSRVCFTVLDLETTGGAPPEHKITEIAAYHIENLEITNEFSTLVNPERSIPPFITNLTGIDAAMTGDMPPSREILPDLLDFIGTGVVVAHNSQFDRRFLDNELHLAGLPRLKNSDLCTGRLARRILPWLPSKSLGNLAAFFGVEIPDRHRAAADALATGKLLLVFFDYLKERGITSLEEVLLFQFGEYDYQE